MSREYDLVTFDCYGTLVDWATGIVSAFAAATGCDPSLREAILAAHGEIEPAVQAGPYRSYREVLDEAAARVARALELAIPAGREGFLADSLPRWPVFPDTLAALERIAGAGYRLGILSNVDDDLLDGTISSWPVAFDIRVTAQAIRSYKPAPVHFHEAARRIGKLRWLHAAQSRFHDVVPAHTLGVPVAWINRRAEPARDDAVPIRELPDLAGLADWLVDSR